MIHDSLVNHRITGGLGGVMSAEPDAVIVDAGGELGIFVIDLDIEEFEAVAFVPAVRAIDGDEVPSEEVAVLFAVFGEHVVLHGRIPCDLLVEVGRLVLGLGHDGDGVAFFSELFLAAFGGFAHGAAGQSGGR